jgi:cyclopropane fatty-acyl-phospholipid synthase-like methyltransferase
MPLSSTLDSYLRRSVLARFIPQLRQRTPRLYNFARNAVNRALPINSEAGLARHQARALDRFRREVPIAPKSVILEIGSDADGRVVREIAAAGAARVVGVNPSFAETPPGDAAGPLPASCQLSPGDARHMDFPDENFDAIFSCAVFEHLCSSRTSSAK